MLRDYISIDLETTGLDAKQDAIIEVAAVKVKNGMQIDTFQSLIDPGREIPEHVVELTGITQKDIQGQPQFKDIQMELLRFLDKDVLLGHSLLFDYSFLKRAFFNNGAVSKKGKDSFERMGIDTLKMARLKLPNLESRSLSSLCKYYKIPLHAHRALDDAKATSTLYQKLTDQFYTAEEEVMFPLIYKVKREGPITKAQKERLYKLLDEHKIIPVYEIDRLTKNQADRYLDKILAEYGR